MQADSDELTALQEAVALHQAGRLDEAAASCRRQLERVPGDPEATSLLGLVLTQEGSVGEALPLLGKAVEIEPEQAGFRLNLAFGLLTAGAAGDAEREVRAVLDRNPANARALELLGDLAAARQDLAAAAQSWRASLSARFSLPPALKLVRYEISNAHFDKAKAALAELIPHYPDVPAVHLANCDLLGATRDWHSLERVARYLTTRFPALRDGWKWLAIALFEVGRYPEAATAYRQLTLSEDPGADELAAYAGLCVHALDFEAAEAALAAAAAIDPEHPGVLQRRAILHLYHGRFGEAEDCCRRCLARDPANVSAYTTLVRVRRGRLSDAELAALESIATNAGAPPDSRIAAAFAVGHVEDARGHMDAAVAAYARAHEFAMARDRAEGQSYDRAASEARAARLPAGLELAPPPAPSAPSLRPIFIVGMPRSGTTLAECVLGAHPEVVACGERMVMRQVLHAWLSLQAAGRAPDAATAAAWRDAVLAGVPAQAGARHFTDKHPLNYEAVGLIARLFPEAAIVWMRRDPVETCLSAWRQEFNKRWGFVHRLGDLGHYYGLHERVMARFLERLPGRITVVRYEEFAADIESGARALLAAVGLPWDARCLEFSSSKRPIATFSTVDARDPVTVRRGRAERYRGHLDELLAALAAAGVAPFEGGGVRKDDPVAG